MRIHRESNLYWRGKLHWENSAKKQYRQIFIRVRIFRGFGEDKIPFVCCFDTDCVPNRVTTVEI